ncbi:MAG TPA: hypothetical protein VEY91_10415 [Candidatus Limnocylindria bacterium]|nr:hypothetical protein [Candidatus Limnocylindria bacterium]
MLSKVTAPFRAQPALPNSSHLSRDMGWTSLTFDVHEPSTAIFVEVQGQAQFDAADIVCSDGEIVSLPLRNSVRGQGMFALHDLGATKTVEQVRITARARSPQARVGLRLGL